MLLPIGCSSLVSWSVLVGLVLAIAPVSLAVAADPHVTGLRVGNHPDRIRVVLDLTGRVDHRIFLLENPYRVVLDTNRVSWNLPGRTDATSRGILKAYRYGLYQPEVSRLVLDLAEPAIVKSSELWAPRGGYNWRLVVDLVPSGQDEFRQEVVRTARVRSDLAYASPLERASALEVPERQDDRRIVVIDAGHGGVDPGALTKSGRREKNIVLSVALRTGRSFRRLASSG